MFQLSGFYCRSPTDPSIQLRLQPSGSLRPKAGGGLCGKRPGTPPGCFAREASPVSFPSSPASDFGGFEVFTSEPGSKKKYI